MLKNSLLLWRDCSSYLQTQFFLPLFLIFCMDVFGCFSHDLPYFSTLYWCDWLWSCTFSWTTCANIVSWWTLAGTCHWHSWFDKEKRWAWSWAEWSKIMSLTVNPVPIHTFLNLEVLSTYTRFFLLLFMCPFDDFPFPWNIKTKIIHHWNKVWWMWVGCNYHIIASFRMLL